MSIDIRSVKGFDWDKWNINKSYDKHGIHFKEAEEVFFNTPLIVHPDIPHSTKEERYHALGQTDEGKKLFISFTLRKSHIRVISARQQNKSERKAYEKHQ